MATKTCIRIPVPTPKGLCRGNPLSVDVPFHPGLEKSTHVTLEVVKESLGEGPIQLSVINGSVGKTVVLTLSSRDTIAKLKGEYIKLHAEVCGKLNLILDGKPVQDHQSLGELGVKSGAAFQTYQLCTGG